ncbi:MAG TPA: TlpA disulfide reductase family protein [Solirubrobacteraceae bacterium]|nr:TlpA disulfide reductase family protein [Solirubrobacteraceae bacterium]
MKALTLALAVALVAAVVAVGLAQRPEVPDIGAAVAAPESRGVGLAQQRAELARAPEPLASLYARGGGLVDATADDVEARLQELRGTPVVLNKWASWCGPCRTEAPFFQQAVARYGDRVAFVGVNSGDDRDSARAFLRDLPVAYPSFFDPDEEIAEAVGAPRGYPITVFLTARGERFVHQGAYATPQRLAEDVERYALNTRSGA